MGKDRDLAPVCVYDVRKRYGAVTAVDGLSFEVREGEVFGLLGPNGAGKTTLLEIIEGLRRPDTGRVTVAGVDLAVHPREARARMGIQLQEAGFFERLTVEETLRTFAAFHRRTVPIGGLLEQVSLADRRRTLVETLSGGQKQRLSVALALLNDPVVVFLDEPTTGLDPQARRNLWELVRAIRGQGRTLVLTTHYMEEAQELCDRVAIMERGRIAALDTPRGLIRAHAPGSRIYVDFGPQGPPAAVEAEVARWPGVTAAGREDGRLSVVSERPGDTLPALLAAAAAWQPPPRGLEILEGTLEDVFLRLTGRRLRD